MGNKKSKPKSKQKPKSKPESSNMTKGKMYMDDPVFGRMVYNEIVGAWVPAYSENMYEDSFNQYNTEKEKNKKYLKTFDIKPEKINNFSEDIHQTLSIIKKIPIKLDIYSYAYFLNDGRLAINWGNKLVIYNENYETIEQEIKEDSIHITQLKDNSLSNCHYHGADIYKYDVKNKKFNFDFTLKCKNTAEKLLELTNDRLALLADFINIYIKEDGKYVKNGEEMCLTTIDDLVQINDNELCSISGQESTVTFWDIDKREVFAQVGDIENFGHNCIILFGKYLIVGGANKNFCSGAIKYIYIINTESKELIKKYEILYNIWFIIKLNEKEFITGGSDGIIYKYRFENNEIKLMEKNEEHKGNIVKKLAFCSSRNHLATMSDKQIIIYKISE
jgi:WD40 repeat protein